MLRFATENSEYEIDELLSRIRRLTGVVDPTPRQGPDGKWKAYVSTTEIRPGVAVFIDWDGKGHGTLTSTVRRVGSE